MLAEIWEHTMSGKRDSSKRQVAFWFSPQERAMLEEVARLRGLNMTEVVKLAITKMLLEDTEVKTNASKRTDPSQGHTQPGGIRGDNGSAQR